MEDETGEPVGDRRGPEPDRPLRDPAPIARPDVDAHVADFFGRPDGVTSGSDPRREAEPPLSAGLVELHADPALAAAFAPGPDSAGGIERHPQWQDEADSPSPHTPDPWRDPHTPVGIGTPAREPSPEPEPLDLTHDPERPPPPRLSLSEVLFERRLTRRALAAAAAVVGVIALVAGGIGAVVADSARLLTTSTVRIQDAPSDSTRPDNPVGEVAHQVQPAVVSIQASTPSAFGTGSGLVIDPQGYIVTNNHVATLEGSADRADIEVIFSDGARAPAELVGTDPATDLAVLKVDDVQGLTVATLGDSDEIEVGEQVVAIGSPHGLTRTVTGGIVSATQRSIALGESTSDGDVVIDAVQTDAAINPGNSGGPLIDARGAVIGINTFLFTESGGWTGLGFAIPVNDVRDIATALMTEGSIDHATLGVNARTADNGNIEGAEIVNVRDGSAAEEGGLREGDIVTRIGDRQVRSSDELVVAVRQAGADREVPVEVVRDGTRVELTVRPTLG